MTPTTVGHPIFALRQPPEPADAARGGGPSRPAAHGRQRSGPVVEIGADNRINFRHYPTTVEEVVALQTEPFVRARAQAAARDAPGPVSVSADELPLKGGWCAAAVARLVLCTVPDPSRALAGPAWGPTNPYVRGVAT